MSNPAEPTTSTPVDLATLTPTQRVVTTTVTGVLLPFTDPTRPDADGHPGTGEVFIDVAELEDLAEQGRWDSQTGAALLLGHDEGLALTQAGLAERETRGGYHRSDALIPLLERWGWR